MSIRVISQAVDVNDPAGIIRATQKSICDLAAAIMADLEKEIGGPGLTWTQIAAFIVELKNKQPEISFRDSSNDN